MLGLQIVNFLENISCCRRCILIYLGERSDKLYVSSSHLEETIKDAAGALGLEVQNTSQEQSLDNCSQQSSDGSSCKIEATDEISDNQVDGDDLSTNGMEPVSKKLKGTVCITCIGLLQCGSSANVIKEISEALVQGGHDAKSFTLALALPICLSLRIHRVWTLLLQAYPHIPDKGRADHIGTVKDVWKNLVGPQLGKMVNKTFVQGQYLNFIMNVGTSYVDDIEDCKILDQLCATMFAIRRKQHKKYATGVYSKQSVDAAIKKLADKEFIKVCPEAPAIPVEAVSFTNMKWQRDSMYMAGRYNKYSRELPQTPWFVDGERKMGSSVQELICKILNESVKAEEHKFSSSGREDVDVRCLGNGRPFVIEFVNPCLTKFSREEMSRFQKAVNNSSQLIKLRDLQVVDKKDVKSLKEGEEEKTKAYCALCITRGGHKPEILNCLSEMTDVVLQQKTPIRVLHRRPLLIRPRMIHEMKASSIDDYFFKLHLTSQAGTYIKEFVHGDLGRTTPNLRTILGMDVDVIALDVERVALDWPPKCGD